MTETQTFDFAVLRWQHWRWWLGARVGIQAIVLILTSDSVKTQPVIQWVKAEPGTGRAFIARSIKFGSIGILGLVGVEILLYLIGPAPLVVFVLPFLSVPFFFWLSYAVNFVSELGLSYQQAVFVFPIRTLRVSWGEITPAGSRVGPRLTRHLFKCRFKDRIGTQHSMVIAVSEAQAQAILSRISSGASISGSLGI